jgi:AraC-like DNA-binding protein/tetratricopeptide (TPR) repeat protein
MFESGSTDQVFIRKLTDIILANLENETFGVDELAQQSGLSRSGLYRRLKKIANRKISNFIREVRLQKALEILQNEDSAVYEVAYKVGFSSPAYFSTCFHEYFGYPPGKVKKGDLENPVEKWIVNISAKKGKEKSIWQSLNFSRLRFLLIFVLIVIVAILIYPKIINPGTLDDLRSSDGRISIAVMPFQNMTDNKIWDGIQINLISYLSNYTELKVRQIEAVSSLLESKGLKDYAIITPSVAGRISQKLDANIFINGIINEAGPVFRVNAQIVNSKTKEVFKSFQIEGPSNEEEIFGLIDSLSVLIKNFLVLTKMRKEISPDLKPYKYTNSPEAYKYFIEADNALKRWDVKTALSLYFLAVNADSNFIPAMIFLSMRYCDLGMYGDARMWCLKAYEKRDRAPNKEGFMAEWYHAIFFETPNEEIKYLREYQDVDDQVPVVYWQTGNAYSKMCQYSKAIPEYEKALEIYKKWGIKPMGVYNYIYLGYAYHETGKFREEKKLYKKAEKDFPNDGNLIYRQAVLALTQENDRTSNELINKFKSVLKENSTSDADIATSLAGIFCEGGLPDKAEEYYRQALSLEPENPSRLNDLAYFLIDNIRDINSGLELIDKALKLDPENYIYMDTKGWGLLKQGNYEEATKILTKASELDIIPDHRYSVFLHLEAAKKALQSKNKQ